MWYLRWTPRRWFHPRWHRRTTRWPRYWWIWSLPWAEERESVEDETQRQEMILRRQRKYQKVSSEETFEIISLCLPLFENTGHISKHRSCQRNHIQFYHQIWCGTLEFAANINLFIYSFKRRVMTCSCILFYWVTNNYNNVKDSRRKHKNWEN